MIDWYWIAANALWILGLAIALAGLSFAYWEKEVKGERLSFVLSRSHWGIHLNVAAALFCLGMAATSIAIWEKGLWFVLAGWYVLKTCTAVRSYINKQRSPD